MCTCSMEVVMNCPDCRSVMETLHTRFPDGVACLIQAFLPRRLGSNRFSAAPSPYYVEDHILGRRIRRLELYVSERVRLDIQHMAVPLHHAEVRRKVN